MSTPGSLFGFSSSNKKVEPSGQPDSQTQVKSELLTRIGEVQVAYDGKITEIKDNLTGHISELNQVRDSLKEKIKEIEEGKGKLSEEKKEALDEMQKIISSIDNNESIKDLKTSVDSVKTTSDEMKNILGIQGDEVSSEATFTPIQWNPNYVRKAEQYIRDNYGNMKKYLAQYYKGNLQNTFMDTFIGVNAYKPNSNSNVFDTIEKSNSFANLKLDNTDDDFSKFKTAVMNIREAMILIFKDKYPNFVSVGAQRGGYLSTHHKRHSKAKRTAKRNFFKFNRNINKHNKTKRRRSKKHHKRRK